MGFRAVALAALIALGALPAFAQPAADDAAVRRLLDRLERVDDAFTQRVRAGYLELARDAPEWVVIDGGQDEDTVAAAVRAAVKDRLGL